jgi:type III secretion protein U
VITGSRVVVAMRYSSSDTRVPMPVARAEADDTVKFVQDARRLKLPIIHDVEAARALFDRVQIGHTIPRELFTPTISCMKRLGIL